MPRLYLFAEGQTELTFADMVLKPHLAGAGVFLHPPVLIAHARRKRRIHRGGGRRYAPMKNDILRFLAQEKGRGLLNATLLISEDASQGVGFGGARSAWTRRHERVAAPTLRVAAHTLRGRAATRG